jgi:hypothetical protein
VKLAEVAELPPLDMMEGFKDPWDKEDKPFIKWGSLKPDILHELINHSDCDGELRAEICAPLADRLEELLPLMPDESGGGHIWSWRGVTQQFIDGLRMAAAAGEAVEFH